MKLNVRNLPVNFEMHGAGRPIVLLPGWTMSAHAMAYLYEPNFAGRQGWKRYYIDPPGHGATPGADSITCLDDFLALLLDVIDILAGSEPFALSGLSLGAYLARGILHRRQENVLGLSMVVPVIIAEDNGRKRAPATVIVQEPGIMDELAEDEQDMFSIAVVRTRQFLNGMREMPQPPIGGSGDMEFLDKIRLNPGSYRCSYAAQSLPRPFPGPTLIVTGRQDASVGYEDAWSILDDYPRATFVAFDRAGHLMEEKFDLVHILMREWLDRVEESTNQ
ncbi:MAG: alpha/beta hydrolase [Candidatus Promineifilaceae bacterium]|nr:alpha/beta hydrolase [Candidatus Promineifilaceae bacterium]